MNKAVAGLARLAGSKLGGYLDDALRIGGQVGQDLATAGLKAGKAKFAPQMVGAASNEVPRVLRETAKSAIPTAGRLLGQGTVLGGLYGLASMVDQQSEYSQPMSNSVGNAEIDRFLMKQDLMQQQFQHELALERARAEARTPGAQYGGSLLDAARAEKELVQAGEVTNQEVMGSARMLYGTGLRAY